MRWTTKVWLLLASVALLSLSLAPISQFYLAWVGLVPWLFVARAPGTKRATFLWSWLAGTLFFGANMWWLYKVTWPGMFTLVGYLGLYFGFAALIFRIPVFAKPQAAVLMMPIVWVAAEYVRGNWSMFGNQGLPWLYLGTTQSPFLAMCQVADIGGVYAVSFWVMMVNALVYCIILERKIIARVIGPIVTVAVVVVAFAVYGVYQLNRHTTRPGPTVLVVQPNYKQSNTGEKGAPDDVRVKFHVDTTNAALDECARRGIKVDLVAWSETMMPPINVEARQILASTEMGQKLEATYRQIEALARERNVAMIVGAVYFGRWQERGDKIIATDRRNSAQFFDATGRTREEDRYDKIHLVPFGEFIPYASIPPIYKLLVALGPKYYEDYILTPGSIDDLKVFEVDGARFVVPICFEDIVGPLVARMVRATSGDSRASGKRADFLVNLTNDGWFMASEMPQHLQAAIFRSIENRTPTARSVNTGVSGFITSTGRVHDTVRANTEGWSVATLELDSRVTVYTRVGDAFPVAALAGTVTLIVYAILRKRRASMSDRTGDAA
jgi:apolipoprotein N-acyltransferase